MNFGSLHIATLWRLSNAGVTSTGLVVDGAKGLRLVITEGGRIVQWERFPTAGLLRRRAESLLKMRRRAGWVPMSEGSGARGRPPGVSPAAWT